jgi:hypothetical protein
MRSTLLGNVGRHFTNSDQVRDTPLDPVKHLLGMRSCSLQKAMSSSVTRASPLILNRSTYALANRRDAM